MSQYLNLLSRRVAADVFESSKSGGEFSKALLSDERVKDESEETREYVRIRGACWYARWKSFDIKTPTALVEDSDMSFDVPVSDQTVEVITKQEAKQEAKPKAKASASKPEVSTEG